MLKDEATGFCVFFKLLILQYKKYLLFFGFVACGLLYLNANMKVTAKEVVSSAYQLVKGHQITVY